MRANHLIPSLALLAGCASMDTGQVAIITTSSADIVTTEILLSQEGYRELNPLLQEQAVRLVAKAAITGGIVYLYRHYKSRGEDRKAKWVAIVASVVWGAAFAWNAHLLWETP